ncbi:MAG TPA: 2-hydroxychromene-2-carboxylate isomerase [Geminicoccus sp.]|jgi:2-hydroxychromene-2-carboxylate isomerase|uniref:2-hydroxychromene-2-carboxylate isomerase n=1 Tax=Geminicoccus sp. TaxID=2024832 RepID=UPI002E321311|nr:2-hydroxychromene-2-carboxylate isomerase [Geminicoccus sp.]HEX2529395.1 2-hydroxychromene-2-carboxylate isomerase [Geminicoccus sp.]
MNEPLDFYFEFASPYAYLASLRIGSIAGAYEREVRWRPIMLGAMFKLTGSVPNVQAPLRGPYFLRDAPRCARLMDAPFTLPPNLPMNSLAASRAFWWLHGADPDMARGFAEAVFFAHWAEGRDLSAIEQVVEVARTLGIDETALREAVADPAIKERLKAETDHAIERGVFGSPFIFVDGEPFWGADRLDHVERWLASGGW